MTAVYSTWLLVAEPRHISLEWSSSCEGEIGVLHLSISINKINYIP
jgi:hypothetical protein